MGASPWVEDYFWDLVTFQGIGRFYWLQFFVPVLEDFLYSRGAAHKGHPKECVG